MSSVTLFHNPRCSKSRQALALLQAAKVAVDIVRYLEYPPTIDVLKALAKALQCGPRDLMRRNEPNYRNLGLDNPALTDQELFRRRAEQPVLLQRPIAIAGKRAVIGRPPENILRLIARN